MDGGGQRWTAGRLATNADGACSLDELDVLDGGFSFQEKGIVTEHALPLAPCSLRMIRRAAEAGRRVESKGVGGAQAGRAGAKLHLMLTPCLPRGIAKIFE